MSRETERLAQRFRPPYKMVVETFSLGTYATGGVWLFSTALKRLERATCLQVLGGVVPYVGQVVTGSVTTGMITGGNAFRLKLWTGGGEIGDAVDLTGSVASVLLEGL